MRKILGLVAALCLVAPSWAQTYSSSQHVPASAAIGFSNPTPTDARSMFWDATNSKYRDYQSLTEVRTYLNTANKRTGSFPIFVRSGGSLAAGVWTGGTMRTYWFKDCLADSCLVEMFPADGNNFIGQPSFNSGTRDLTIPRTGLSSVVVNIPAGSGGSSAAPALFHFWDFNNNTTDSAIRVPTLSFGNLASITHLPGVSSVIDAAGGTGQDFDINNLNARTGVAAGAHLRFNNPVGGALIFHVPTTNFEDVKFSFVTRRSGSGAHTQKWSYSLDGTSWTLFQTLTSTETAALQELDFASVAGADNNDSFKVMVEFEAGGGGTAGNNRFDNVAVEGVPITAFTVIQTGNSASSQSGSGVPDGGSTGDVLQKFGDADGEATWASPTDIFDDYAAPTAAQMAARLSNSGNVSFTLVGDSIRADNVWNGEFASPGTIPNTASSIVTKQRADSNYVTRAEYETQIAFLLSLIQSGGGTTTPAPLQYPNLLGWYRSDTGVVLSGSNVTTWSDLSGNGNDLIASSGLEPTLVASGGANNLPYLQFSGASALYAPALPLGNVQDVTIYVVLKNTTSSTTSALYQYSDNQHTHDTGFYAFLNDCADNTIDAGHKADAGRSQMCTAIPLNTWAVLRSEHYKSHSGGEAGAYVNGSGGSITPDDDNTNSFGANEAFYLCSGQNTGFFAHAEIAEVIIYSKKASSGEVTAIHNYLNTKYALP